ncbi:hypothetical protein DEO72_LG11g2371 [Vigna unguiculata]|uniref:Uncharacterized protein n=1 Tax=Vigna unguiculata TaxID=3917 RepID=A0A4D6NR08_VIGUN|nr:hypothetical protein DEO72_LG11g2371 [Vigna unguiculata]
MITPFIQKPRNLVGIHVSPDGQARTATRFLIWNPETGINGMGRLAALKFLASLNPHNTLSYFVLLSLCSNGEQVNISESLVGSLCSSVERLDSSDSSVSIVDSSDLEQEEQLCAEKDLRVVLEVQVEKWQLSDLLTRARPIQRNSVNDKLAIERIKNPAKGKSAKVKMKSFKEKIKKKIWRCRKKEPSHINLFIAKRLEIPPKVQL